VCYNCKQPGHYATTCEIPRNVNIAELWADSQALKAEREKQRREEEARCRKEKEDAERALREKQEQTMSALLSMVRSLDNKISTSTLATPPATPTAPAHASYKPDHNDDDTAEHSTDGVHRSKYGDHNVVKGPIIASINGKKDLDFSHISPAEKCEQWYSTAYDLVEKLANTKILKDRKSLIQSARTVHEGILDWLDYMMKEKDENLTLAKRVERLAKRF
jgi:hypothetical protein